MKFLEGEILPLLFFICLSCNFCENAKINTPRVLLPWFENKQVNFTFEIYEGGCYSWSLSRDDIIDLEPIHDDSWGHCSRAARVSVSKNCAPPGSVIVLAEEVNTGEILRGDVDIDFISSLKVMSTTWKLFLEEAPEAFEVIAYDDQGNKFSTLEGVSFTWTIKNLGNAVNEEPLVKLVNWGDTDYEAPRGVSELEALGRRSSSVLLYGQAMGDSRVNVCLNNICTDFNLQVVASVVLTPAVASIALGDTLKYRIVRARAGRLTVQDISDTLYRIELPDDRTAIIEDTVSLVRGLKLGSTNVILYSGVTEVATATLNVVEPHSIRISIRPSNLVIRNEPFVIHCVVLDVNGHVLTAGDEMLIRLSVSEANVELLRSTENGTLTDAVAHSSGAFVVTARLHSVAGKQLSRKVENQATAVAVDPLEVVPEELFVAWTDIEQDVQLHHIGGGDEEVVWSESETENKQHMLSLSPPGVVTVRGIGDVTVKVQLKKYSYVRAFGRVWSAVPEYLQVSSSGHARVGRPHQLHVALTATHPQTGELYNFHVCNCDSFAVSLLDGPEPHNIVAATWVKPADGACCVLEATWASRGISTVTVSRGRAMQSTRIHVRAAPQIVWPLKAAALINAQIPVLALGESLYPQSSETRVAEFVYRDEIPPHKYPDVQLFTMKCRRKGDARLEVISQATEEIESVDVEASCVAQVAKIKIEPPETTGNCSGGPRLWLRPGSDVYVRVTLYDAIGRELLDELGPKTSWEMTPKHSGIEFKAADRLIVETHPEYVPVQVPYKYYQVIVADEQAIGWTGTIKVSIPDASATIQARVAAPLRCDPMKINLAWEGENVSDIASITGGSGRYAVTGPKGVTASVLNGSLSAVVPGAGSYELVLTDQCVDGETIYLEVNIEEILSVEVSTARAVCVDGCVPITALVRGVSHRYLNARREPEWRTSGNIVVRGDKLCGLKEGNGRVRASLGGVWSSEVDVLVFPPLELIPSKVVMPPTARSRLRYKGGPPSHLATLEYSVVDSIEHIEVSNSGTVHGLSVGKARVRLTAKDINNAVMATAESHVEVIPIKGLKVHSGTQTLLVGHPAPLWLEAEGLSPRALDGLRPAPRVTWSIRDPTTARLYVTHVDDVLERSVAEGLSVRVVPTKPGVVIVDVRVKNMGHVTDTKAWESTIEILGLSDIKPSVEGLPQEFTSTNRLALAVGSSVKLKSVPRSNWEAIGDNFELSSDGQVKALQPGFGVIVAMNRDERNNVYRETLLHVEVAVPQYCTIQPSADEDAVALRVVLRNSIGRELISPTANLTAFPPVAVARKSVYSALGKELLLTGIEGSGSFLSVEAESNGVTVVDEVWISGSDLNADRVFAAGGWAVCIPGIGWRAPPSVSLYEGNGVTLAVLTKDGSAKHVLRGDRPPRMMTVHQMPVEKMSFEESENGPLSVISIKAEGLSGLPLLCTEQQRYAIEGLAVTLPFTCHTQAPHRAEAVLDIQNGKMGCTIIPGNHITKAIEVELCAEWGVYRTCTKVLLLPPIEVSTQKLSLLHPPTEFAVLGHNKALRNIKITTSPGLKIDKILKDDELYVNVVSEDLSCGVGWVVVESKLTDQEFKIEVDRECDVACGTILGALMSFLRPHLSTLVTMAGVAAVTYYVLSRLSPSVPIKQPLQTTLPTPDRHSFNRSTWSRSPYSSSGPVGPIYGDTSVLPDNSISPNSTRMHSRFL